jgi:hypothetical protein
VECRKLSGSNIGCGATQLPPLGSEALQIRLPGRYRSHRVFSNLILRELGAWLQWMVPASSDESFCAAWRHNPDISIPTNLVRWQKN